MTSELDDLLANAAGIVRSKIDEQRTDDDSPFGATLKLQQTSRTLAALSAVLNEAKPRPVRARDLLPFVDMLTDRLPLTGSNAMHLEGLERDLRALLKVVETRAAKLRGDQ